QFDLKRDGIWNIHPHNNTWWFTDTPKRTAVAIRPEVMVCPTDTAEPMTGQQYSLPFPAATGSYALCSGTNGPRWGIDTMQVKLGNNGMFVYAKPRKQKEVLDGLSKTFVFGEVYDGHAPQQTGRIISNIW